MTTENLEHEIGLYRKKVKVFLGGTVNGSNWRNKIIKDLKIDYFNPVVDDWNADAIANEYLEKNHCCDFQLYIITPKMSGVFSIAEVVDSSNKKPKRTIFCILEKDDNKTFDAFQKKSLEQVKELVKNNGSFVFNTLKECSNFLNQFYME